MHWKDPGSDAIDLSVWRQVKRKYGQSVVTIPTFLKGKLDAVISVIKPLNRCELRFEFSELVIYLRNNGRQY